MGNYAFHCYKIGKDQKRYNLEEFSYIDEVDDFSLCIESDIKLNDFTILITDILIGITDIGIINNKFWYQLDLTDIKKYFSIQGFEETFEKYYLFEGVIENTDKRIWFTKLFINYPIGVCDINLFDNKSDKTVLSISFNIVSSKIDENEFSSLVSYVEEKGTSIWTKYSLLKHTAEKLEKQNRTEWLLNLCESFTKILFNKHLVYFEVDKIKVIQPKNEIQNYSLDVNISEDSLLWLTNNLNVLHPTVSYDTNKILINNRLFTPTEILGSEFEESTDINENQLMHGFLSELKIFLIKQKNELETKSKKIQNIKFEDIIEFYSIKRNLQRIENILKSLEEIKSFMDKHIPVSNETLEFLNTNKIESKEHYNFVYENLVEWLLYKDALFSNDKKYFKGINRMDKLFERACFFKLIDSFIKLEYEIEVIKVDEDEFPIRVKLTKNGVINYLNFEILPDSLITMRRHTTVLKPDFIIELENNRFIIFDAKYKKQNNIFKYDLSDLTMKYLHGIGNKNGGFFNCLGLFVLYPDTNNKIDFYQKDEFNLFSKEPVFPSIASIPLNFEEESISLNKSIKKILNM